jgi:DNA-binding NarL/FixJ family response regulator
LKQSPVFSLPTQPPVRGALPRFGRPVLVFARDEAAGAYKDSGAAFRVLVAEDDYLVGMQMEDALTEAGFALVAVVVSAEEAIETAVAARVDLVIMDIRLAGRLDGIDAAIELFRQHGIRCVFATAHTDAGARARAHAANPLGWLQKPYSMTSLVELVRRARDTLRGEDE